MVLPALLLVTALGVPAAAVAQDREIQNVKERMKVEAERVEAEFADGRALAYKLVRTDSPKLSEALAKLDALQDLVEKDTALSAERRKVFLVTIKADIKNVRDIAAERSRATEVKSAPKPSDVRRDQRTEDNDRPSRYDDFKSRLDSSSKALQDSKDARREARENSGKLMRDVEKSAIPATDRDRFPKDWAKRVAKRSDRPAMSTKEKAILEAMNKTIEVDFDKMQLTDVLAYLNKKVGLDFAADKLGLQDAGVSYETTVTYQGRATVRSIIKRVLGDLNLGYYIKDETVQITSRERASKETSVRTYYIGDLGGIPDARLGQIGGAIQMIGVVNNIINLIKNVEPKSWADNDPDGVGTIAFDPVTMQLVIRQTAEMHFRLGGTR